MAAVLEVRHYSQPTFPSQLLPIPSIMELPSSVIVDAEDRTNFIPKHQGPAVLPNFALFSRLLRFAHKGPRTVIKDVIVGFSATHIQLLTDVLNVRNVLQESLEEPVLRQLENGEEVFINVLSPGGYEYTVAFLAVVALGAVVVPLCMFPSTLPFRARP